MSTDGGDAAETVVENNETNDTNGANGTRVRSVARAMALARLAAEMPGGMTAEDARARLGVSLGTAYHLLNTLVDSGMLSKQSRTYHLGPLAAVIAHAFSRQESTPPYLLEPLARLARTIGETATLSVWRNGGVLEVAVYEGDKPLQVGGRPAQVQHDLHARASGKLLLSVLSSAELEEYLLVHPLEPRTRRTLTDEGALRGELELVREQGWAQEIEECDEGIACLAVNVTAGGFGTCAYAIGAPAWRMSANREAYLDALLGAAAEASAAMPPA